MRIERCLLGAALCAASSMAQQPATGPNLASEIHSALAGDWVGVLEYRDYSQPVTSTARVDLPTWLNVSSGGEGKEVWHYVYDDGPNKTVDETELVTFDPAHATYTSVDNGKPAQTFQAAGYAALKSGRGKLVLTRSGTDAGKPAELRITLTIRRHLLEMLEETRPAATQSGSGSTFAFRHLYRFVRREAPAVTAPR